MNDYDIYLRHATVRGGAWVGFALAWKGLAGVEGLELRPHLHWRPWLLNPANPNDPTAGSWGVWQWRMDLAAFDVMHGLLHTPPADVRTAADMRADWLAYLALPVIDLKDVDGVQYSVKMTAFQEQLAKPYDSVHTGGDWVARVEFALVSS